MHSDSGTHATYFTHSNQRLADGTSFHQRGLFCASNRWPLGTVLSFHSRRTGRSVVVTVRDHSARWVRTPDLCSRAAARLDPHYRVIGRLPVTIRVIRQAHQTRYARVLRRTRRHG